MAGVVRRRQERSSARSGERFAFISLSDPTGEYEVLFPPESLRRCRDTLEPGQAVIIKVRVKGRDGEVRFFGDDAEPLEKSMEGAIQGLRLHLSAKTADLASLSNRLSVAQGERGGEVVVIAALDGGREVEMRLPGRFRLDPALLAALKTAPGVVHLESA